MSMHESIRAAQVGAPRPTTNGTTIFEFNFSPEDRTFAGHFPGRPILPGVFQIEMVRLAAESVLNCALSLTEIRKAKFQRPIAPGETVRVELRLSVDQAIRARANFSVSGQEAGEMILFLCRRG